MSRGPSKPPSKKMNTRYYESFIAQQHQEHTSHIPIQIKMSNSQNKKNQPQKKQSLTTSYVQQRDNNNIEKSHKHTSKTTFLIT